MWKRTKKNVIKFIFSYLMIKTEHEKFNKKIQKIYITIFIPVEKGHILSIYIEKS